MYIVSDFRDYYDSVSSFGIDKQCPYIRKTVKSEHKMDRRTPHPATGSTYHNRSHSYDVSYRLVGFCGKIYPMVIVSKSNDRSPSLKPDMYYFYEAEKLTTFLAKEKVRYNQLSSWWGKGYTLSEVNGIELFFEPDTWKHLLENFYKHKTPIFVIGSKHLILNPRLKDYGFQQIKDAFTTYQDVYMYISGVIGVNTKPMIEVSDKVKAASKGHDGKYSFKKTPGGKRGKPRWR